MPLEPPCYGLGDGDSLGDSLGDADGDADGDALGLADGDADGDSDGAVSHITSVFSQVTSVVFLNRVSPLTVSLYNLSLYSFFLLFLFTF